MPRPAGKLAAIGIGVGVIGALASTRLLRGLLYDVAPIDLATLAAAPALLGVVAVAASWLPARRAAKADPLVAMRND